MAAARDVAYLVFCICTVAVFIARVMTSTASVDWDEEDALEAARPP
jgi:hypothetical protein